MDLQIIMIVLMVIGVVFLGISIFGNKFINYNEQESTNNKISTANKNLDYSIEEGRRLVKSLNEMTEYIVNEIEGKNKELLFLYELIERKEKLLNQAPIQEQKLVNRKHEIINNKIENEENLNKRKDSNSILELYNEGNSPIDIAKKLNLGIGEVKLMIDFHKMK